MDIPKTIEEMRDTPIPSEHLKLLGKGNYDHPELRYWLQLRCRKGPNRAEALTVIRIKPKYTAKPIPKKVTELFEKEPLTSEEWAETQ